MRTELCDAFGIEYPIFAFTPSEHVARWHVPPEQTRPLFDAAREPKRWQSYPGTAHGTQLLTSPHGPEVKRLLTEFVSAGAPR